jgi:hypothetical protein
MTRLQCTYCLRDGCLPGGRLLLDAPLEVNPTQPKREKALRHSGPKIGSVVTGEVTAVHALHADVELTSGTIPLACMIISFHINLCILAIPVSPGRFDECWNLARCSCLTPVSL